MRLDLAGNYLRMRGEEHGKVSVKLYQHALGQAAAPAHTMVPAARSRAEWMDNCAHSSWSVGRRSTS